MKNRIIALCSVLFLLFACTDDLERLPKDQFVIKTTFTTDRNFEIYAWRLYNQFPNVFNSGGSLMLDEEFNTDLMDNSRNNTNGSDWFFGRVVIPGQSSNYSDPYRWIRAANLMLDNIDGANALTEVQKAHWRSVGYFFRSYSYYNLLSKYGGVIWLENTLSDADTDILYGERDSRDFVAATMLEDLQYAADNIIPEGITENFYGTSINRNTVLAFISRFGLFEGTWRKYHGLSNATTYIQASADASEELVNNNTLHTKYVELFNSESLAGVPGIFLYRQFEFGELGHSLSTRYRNSSGQWNFTKKGADMFLYQDGTPVKAYPNWSTLEQNPYTEFRDRDTRMYVNITPPFKVNAGADNFSFVFTNNPGDREYIDLLASLFDQNTHSLPDANWNGFIVRNSPHYRKFNQGQGYNVCESGYNLFKYFNLHSTGAQHQDGSDLPIFRLGEVMVNYAEAKYELGEFNQSIADATINKLRARGNVAPLNLGSIIEDPDRDPDITPELWEIRRERAVELAGEAFRWDDLRRWKKVGDYCTSGSQVGRWITAASTNNRLPIVGGGTAGYILLDSWRNPPVPFEDYMYLYPIPSNEILQNPQLGQNPFWE